MSGPLSGVTVLEMCNTIAGPACGRLLADFGANVIKLEPPEGDSVRQLGDHIDGVSLYAASILRNKRSVAIDLKTREGRELGIALASKVDVLIENNRPGVLERLGFDFEELSQANRGLVLVRISGYGQSGPYSDRPGYGAICEAVGGVRHMTGRPDLPPDRVALATTDYLTSVYAAFGALAALRAREQTGRGQIVDVALYETAFTQMEPVVPAYDKLKIVPSRQGPNLPSMAPNSLYPTRDGKWVLIAANSDRTFHRLAEAMGAPELLGDERFSSIVARGKHENARALDGIIGAWTSGLDAVDAERVVREAGVPSSRVYTIADIWDDPQYAARGMLLDVPHMRLGSIKQIGIVPKLSSTPGSVRFAGPELGADTFEVLRELAEVPEERLRSLASRGVIKAGEDAHGSMRIPEVPEAGTA